MGMSQHSRVLELILLGTSVHGMLCCVIGGLWSSPSDHTQHEKHPWRATSPDPNIIIYHLLSLGFFHIDGTCPDPMLLFSREMTNHL